eukprot:gene8938-887_t
MLYSDYFAPKNADEQITLIVDEYSKDVIENSKVGFLYMIPCSCFSSLFIIFTLILIAILSIFMIYPARPDVRAMNFAIEKYEFNETQFIFNSKTKLLLNHTSFFTTSITELSIETTYDDDILFQSTIGRRDGEPLFDLVRDVPKLYTFQFQGINNSMSSNLTAEIKDEIQIQNKTISLKFNGFGSGSYLIILPYYFHFEFIFDQQNPVIKF